MAVASQIMRGTAVDYTGAALRFFNNVIYTTGGIGLYDSSQTIGVVTARNNLIYNTGTNRYGNLCVYVNTAGSMIHSHNALFRTYGVTGMVALGDVTAGTWKDRSYR